MNGNKTLSPQSNIPEGRGQKYPAPNNQNNIDRQSDSDWVSSNVGALTDVILVHLRIRADTQFNPHCALIRIYYKICLR